MRRILVLLLCSFITLSFSQNKKDAFKDLLLKNIDILEKADDEKSIEAVLNRFERLKQNANNEWLPLYYSAYCKIRLASLSKSGSILDEAIAEIEKAKKINKNSDLLALLSRAYMTKIELDISQGPKLTNTVKTTLDQALILDKNNPRVYLMYGKYLYYFPKFVGGDKDKALQFFKKAKPIFEKEYELNKVKPSVVPHWGKKLNDWFIAQY